MSRLILCEVIISHVPHAEEEARPEHSSEHPPLSRFTGVSLSLEGSVLHVGAELRGSHLQIADKTPAGRGAAEIAFHQIPISSDSEGTGPISPEALLALSRAVCFSFFASEKGSWQFPSNSPAGFETCWEERPRLLFLTLCRSPSDLLARSHPDCRPQTGTRPI